MAQGLPGTPFNVPALAVEERAESSAWRKMSAAFATGQN
jgi:hypothetical protein